MLTLLPGLSAETSLLNSVPLTADLTNGEAKTYKLLLDVDNVRKAVGPPIAAAWSW